MRIFAGFSRTPLLTIFTVYVSYLFFQFWSHSHHFRDADTPSNKLPNAVSVRSMASRVRPNSPNLRKLASPSSTFGAVFRSPRAPFMIPSDPGDASVIRGPYMYRQAPDASPPRSGILVSPRPVTSQTTVVAPIPVSAEISNLASAPAAASTVRLINEVEARTLSSDGGYSDPKLNHGRYMGTAESCDGSPDRVSVVSDLVSSYYADTETLHERRQADGSNDGLYYHGHIKGGGTRSRIQLSDEPGPSRTATEVEDEGTGLNAKKPQLSWFLTLVVLTVVTVVCVLTLTFCKFLSRNALSWWP